MFNIRNRWKGCHPASTRDLFGLAGDADSTFIPDGYGINLEGKDGTGMKVSITYCSV